MSISDDIWGMDLIFAARTLRETRERLEAGRPFKSETAVRCLDDCLEEAARIKALLEKRTAA